ncbi:MAG: PQQ-binding-like beta-propeller repeat protein, partial [Planctomycetes bacterium]|nr:PQQ-binding-like beta-propeller repeat protein [Planctomycetota bacterium]
TAVDWKAEKIAWTDKPAGSEFPYHASAAVTDKHVVVGSHDKHVHCFDRKTGGKLWSFPTRAKVNSSAVIVGERVFVGSNDHHVYGLSLADGKELWKFDAGQDVSAGLAVGEGVLVFGTEGSDGLVYCIGEKR